MAIHSILITGIGRRSGKTTVARVFAHVLEYEVFKPMSAHNFWDHYDHSLFCQEKGMMFSYDALLLREASESSSRIELINPYHELWSPSGDVDLPVAVRVSSQEKNILYMDPRAIEQSLVPWEYISGISQGHEVVECGSMINNLTVESIAMYALIDVYGTRSRPLIIESFTDIAIPFEHKTEHVVVVSPGCVGFYDEKFFQAADMLSSRKTLDITEVLKPLETIKVKPLEGRVISDMDALSSELEYLVRAFEKASTI